MPLPPPHPTTTDQNALLLHAQFALGMSQGDLGALLGVSRRTIIRWHRSGPIMGFDKKQRLVHALHPRDPALAAQVATAFGESLASLGVALPVNLAPAPPSGISASHLADSIVCAAAEAAGLSPQAIRPALVAALERAAAFGLGVDDVRKALAPPAGKAKKG